MTTLRADLHVHTYQSKYNPNFAAIGSRDCYSRPDDVYRVAKARGMDLVAITDHDTIDGALELLDRRPGADDIIVGEEVSCRFPDGDLEVHFGVYGMTESLHRELQPLRKNAFDVAACLCEADVFFALNHLLHFYDLRVSLEAYLRLLDAVPAVEVRNGTMHPLHNTLVAQIAERWKCATGADRLAAVAGSDAHTLRRIGTTWTEVPARNRDEFLLGLRGGLGRAGGRDGSALAIAGDAYGVIRSYVASLVGVGPQDHRPLHRALCLGFVALSLPFQFLPIAVGLWGKSQEIRRTRYVSEHLAGRLEQAQPRDAPMTQVRA